MTQVALVSGTPGSIQLSADTAPTIEALFDRIERNLTSTGAVVTQEFDPTWHIPTRASFALLSEADGFETANFQPEGG